MPFSGFPRAHSCQGSPYKVRLYNAPVLLLPYGPHHHSVVGVNTSTSQTHATHQNPLSQNRLPCQPDQHLTMYPGFSLPASEHSCPQNTCKYNISTPQFCPSTVAWAYSHSWQMPSTISHLTKHWTSFACGTSFPRQCNILGTPLSRHVPSIPTVTTWYTENPTVCGTCLHTDFQQTQTVPRICGIQPSIKHMTAQSTGDPLAHSIQGPRR